MAADKLAGQSRPRPSILFTCSQECWPVLYPFGLSAVYIGLSSAWEYSIVDPAAAGSTRKHPLDFAPFPSCFSLSLSIFCSTTFAAGEHRILLFQVQTTSVMLTVLGVRLLDGEKSFLCGLKKAEIKKLEEIQSIFEFVHANNRFGVVLLLAPADDTFMTVETVYKSKKTC